MLHLACTLFRNTMLCDIPMPSSRTKKTTGVVHPAPTGKWHGSVGTSQVPVRPQLSVRVGPATPVGPPSPDHCGEAMLPLVSERQGPQRSTLNFEAQYNAFELAVYASPGGLLTHDAKLASGGWSDLTGWARPTRYSMEGFVMLTYTCFTPSCGLNLPHSDYQTRDKVSHASM